VVGARAAALAELAALLLLGGLVHDGAVAAAAAGLANSSGAAAAAAPTLAAVSVASAAALVATAPAAVVAAFGQATADWGRSLSVVEGVRAGAGAAALRLRRARPVGAKDECLRIRAGSGPVAQLRYEWLVGGAGRQAASTVGPATVELGHGSSVAGIWEAVVPLTLHTREQHAAAEAAGTNAGAAGSAAYAGAYAAAAGAFIAFGSGRDRSSNTSDVGDGAAVLRVRVVACEPAEACAVVGTTRSWTAAGLAHADLLVLRRPPAAAAAATAATAAVAAVPWSSEHETLLVVVPVAALVLLLCCYCTFRVVVPTCVNSRDEQLSRSEFLGALQERAQQRMRSMSTFSRGRGRTTLFAGLRERTRTTFWHRVVAAGEGGIGGAGVHRSPSEARAAGAAAAEGVFAERQARKDREKKDARQADLDARRAKKKAAKKMKQGGGGGGGGGGNNKVQQAPVPNGHMSTKVQRLKVNNKNLVAFRADDIEDGGDGGEGEGEGVGVEAAISALGEGQGGSMVLAGALCPNCGFPIRGMAVCGRCGQGLRDSAVEVVAADEEGAVADQPGGSTRL
jgi:hypothetical protein